MVEKKKTKEKMKVCPFAQDLDSEKYKKMVLDTLEKHYCLLVFKYVPAKPLGQMHVTLTPDILAHFIMVHACACALSIERTTDEAHAGYNPGFGDSLSGGDDYLMALDSDKFPDYAMIEAKKILDGDITQGYTSEEKLRADIEKIVPRDPKLIMIWDAGMQNMAKAHGEFKLILEAALKSDDLKKMPKVIAELNTAHISDLLHPFRMGKLCPNCGWNLPCVGGITTMASCGDEEDYRHFQCENDGKFFVSKLHDKAMSDDTDESFYEITPKQAKADLEAIKKCPKPDDKHCKCETHRNYKF